MTTVAKKKTRRILSENYLSTREAAALLKVSLSNVQRMVESGELPGWKTQGGHRRIPLDAINKKLQDRAAQGAVHRRDLNAMPALQSIGSSDEYSILVVEDDAALLKLYRAKISGWKLPIKLITAEDGYDAIMKVSKERPDLMIVDVKLPKVGGVEVIRRIRSEREFDAMSIIVVTGLDAEALANQGDLPKDITILGKPVPFAQLLGFVQAGVAQKGRLNSA
jgi:excisionase family DNA binding protein